MSVETLDTIAAIREYLAQVRRAAANVALVPTMGALHAGHGRLIELARQESDCLVVSIFVNPIQFDRLDDFNRYPRPMEADLEFCDARGVDVIFAPSAQEMYPRPQSAFVEVTGVTEHLCGEYRPGHFRGVATVVAKLFHIVQPERAYFGEKDAQQLAVIRRMVRDLDMPVEIVEVPTVRESDGLAISSRNQHLSAAERQAAPSLYRALELARSLIAHGLTDAAKVKQQARAALDLEPQIRVEYLEIVDPEDMQPVDRITRPVRVAAAAWLGATRLIDNVLCKPE